MAGTSNFPTSKDTFTDPEATDRRTSPSLSATVQKIHAVVDAHQDVLGITGSTDTSTIEYILKNTTGGHDHDGTDSKALPATAITAHASRHQDTGADEISLAGLAGEPATLTTHKASADDHTGYRLESADHTHQATGAQAGQLDHGLALTGLADDDHTQYALDTDLTTHKTAATLDHPDLSVTAAKMAANAVSTGAIADGAGTSRKLNPTMGKVAATASLSVTTTEQDVAGATVDLTLAVASKFLVWSIWDVASVSGGVFIGYVNWNGSNLTGEALLDDANRHMLAQVHYVEAGAGTFTLKLRAKMTAGTATLGVTHTSLSYLVFSNV